MYLLGAGLTAAVARAARRTVNVERASIGLAADLGKPRARQRGARPARASSLIIQRFAAKPGVAMVGAVSDSGTILELGAAAARPVRRAAGRRAAVGHAAGRPGRGDPARPGRSRARCCRTSNGSSTRARMHPGRRRSARASLSGPEQVDFILANRRARARPVRRGLPGARFLRRLLPAARRTSSCARERDAIHSRMGGSCTIERFKQLVPIRR